MKKINVTLNIVTVIAIHVLLLFIFIGTKPEKKPKKTKSTTTEQPKSTPAKIPEFKIPDLAIPDQATLSPLPIAPLPAAKRVQPQPSTPRETIASTSNRTGYIRADRPNRRTKQVFNELKNDPYQSAIVIDARSGKILFEDRAAVYAYPASITKLMTMLIVLEQIDAGSISHNDRVKITKEVAGIGGSGVYLDVRETEQFTVENLLKALMIHSANDAAAALAFHVAGSIDGFVDMMNQKARELGMNSTTYHSPHGLPPSGNAQPDISTAYDIAILSLAALRHPETLNYTSTKLDYLPLSSIRKERFMLANRNALVGKDPYPGCDGLKTGYHSKGGSSLTATAKQGNNRVIAVTLGCPNKNIRNATVRKLLDKGFESLK